MMTGKENPKSEYRNPMLLCEVALLRSTRTNSNEQNKSRILGYYFCLVRFCFKLKNGIIDSRGQARSRSRGACPAFI